MQTTRPAGTDAYSELQPACLGHSTSPFSRGFGTVSYPLLVTEPNPKLTWLTAQLQKIPLMGPPFLPPDQAPRRQYVIAANTKMPEAARTLRSGPGTPSLCFAFPRDLPWSEVPILSSGPNSYRVFFYFTTCQTPKPSASHARVSTG